MKRFQIEDVKVVASHDGNERNWFPNSLWSARILLQVLLFLFLSNCNLTKSERIDQSNTLRTQAEERMEANEFGKARDLLDQSIVLEREIGDTLRLIKTLYLATRNSAFSGQFDQAIIYGIESAALSKAQLDLENEYKANSLLSWAYFETRKDFKKRQAHQQRQIFLVNEIGNPRYKANVYNNYGYDATVAGSIHLKEALDYMHFANNHYAENEDHQGRWYTLMNLTWIYRLMADFDNSIKYGKLSVAQAVKDSDRHAIIEANTNLAETYLEIGRLDLAEPLYEEAEGWNDQGKDRDKFVFDVYYSGFLERNGKVQQAISLLEDAVAFLESGEVFYEMLGRFRLATLYVGEGRIDDAKSQLNTIKNPRHDYFAFEVKAMAEKLASDLNMENELHKSISQAEEIGSQSLLTKLRQ